MRKCLGVVAVLIFAGAAIGQTALSTLGVKDSEARDQAVRMTVSGRAPVGLVATAFRAANGATRGALIQGILAWIKAYAQSAAFKEEYDRQREQNRPAAPKRTPVDEELAKQKAERAKSLDEMRKSIAQMPANLQADMRKALKEMEAQYAKMDTDPQMAKTMRQALDAQGTAEEQSYRERVAAFEKNYPADPKVLIAQRIRQFLEISKDVDFNAQLVQAGKLKKFAKPAYESKPDTWKLCYRAGPEAVSAARTFAMVWLKELN
jgi:hypothetical protein